MEKTTVLTKLDYRTLKYCNLFILKFRKKVDIWFLVTAIISLAVIIYGAFFLEDGLLFCVLGAMFFVYAIYQALTLEKRLDIQLERFFYGRKGIHTQTIEISDEKVVLTRSIEPEKPIEYDWSFVTEINEMPQFYLLMIGKDVPIIVDRSEEAILNGSKEHLDKIIHEKASMKPYKRIDKDIVKKPITFVHPLDEEEPFDAKEAEVEAVTNVSSNEVENNRE